MTNVLVTTTPTLPCCPVLGMFTPRSAAWFRTLSGVSPCGVDHITSPLSILMPTTTPYGGLTIFNPCTVAPKNPPPAPPAPAAPPRPAPAGAVLAAGGGVGGGAGAVAGRRGA